MSRTVTQRPSSPEEVGERVQLAAARTGLTHERIARGIGLARTKLYLLFNGEKNVLLEHLYRSTDTVFVREVLADVAACHGLVVTSAPADAVTAGDPRDALRLVEKLASACGDAVTQTARVVADGMVDAAEGAVLEQLGTALIERGQSLVRLGRRAKRERVLGVALTRSKVNR